MRKRMIRAVWSAALCLCLSVSVWAGELLVPVGRVVGLSLAEGSVTVAAFDDVLGEAAKAAGLQIGDEILTVDGTVIDSAADLHEALSRSQGTVELLLCRRGEERTVRMAPQITPEGPKLGVFIREGVTGIGTVTYYDPEEGTFGALGHGVSDSRGSLCRMRRGDVYAATVAGVRAGKIGAPGQLKGDVSGTTPIGALSDNTPFGVFGTCRRWPGEALPVAEPEEVRTGPAVIMSNISGSDVELFTVEILKVYDTEGSNGRDLMLHVTDPQLLEATGGIVAGMSGSPICQNGKIVGAVTHVLVNSPDTGYGIFIENMLDAAS